MLGECKTTITVVETSGETEFAIGGTSNNRLFVTGSPPGVDCLSHSVPFVAMQNNLNTNGPKWIQFFGSATNDTYSDVVNIKFGFEEIDKNGIMDPRVKTRSDFFFVILKSTSNSQNSHKMFALQSTDGSYSHDNSDYKQNDVGEIPVTLPDKVLPNMDQVLIMFSREANSLNELRDYSAIILSQDPLVGGKPVIIRVDFWKNSDLNSKSNGNRVNSYSPSANYLLTNEFKFPFKSIIYSGNRKIFVGGSIVKTKGQDPYCPLLMQIDHNSESGFNFDKSNLKITNAWKMDCSGTQPFFSIDKLVTNYVSATDVRLFGLMSPRDAQFNLVKNLYFLILMHQVEGTSLADCNGFKTIKVTPAGTTSNYMRFLQSGVSVDNGLKIFMIYEQENVTDLTMKIQSFFDEKSITGYSCAGGFATPGKMKLWEDGKACLDSIGNFESGKCKTPILHIGAYEQKMMEKTTFSYNLIQGNSATYGGDSIELIGEIDGLTIDESFTPTVIYSSSMFGTYELSDCTSAGIYTIPDLLTYQSSYAAFGFTTSIVNISKSAPSTYTAKFVQITTTVSDCTIVSYLLSSSPTSYVAVNSTIFSTPSLVVGGERFKFTIIGSQYLKYSIDTDKIYVFAQIPNSLTKKAMDGYISIALFECGGEVITTSKDTFSVVLPQSTSIEYKVKWDGTTDTYCNQTSCETSYGEFPYFISSLGVYNQESCRVNNLTAYTSDTLKTQFRNGTLAIFIYNSSEQPAVTFIVDTTSGSKEEIYFKGQSYMGKYQKTKILITVCGNEQFSESTTAQDMWEFAAFDYENDKITYDLLFATADFTAGTESDESCRLDTLTLCTDAQCTEAIEDSGPVVSYLGVDTKKYIQVDLTTVMAERSYFVKHSANSDQSLCKEIKIKVTGGCKPIFFNSDVLIPLEITLQQGKTTFDLTKQPLDSSGISANCPINAVKITQRLQAYTKIATLDLTESHVSIFSGNFLTLDKVLSPKLLTIDSSSNKLKEGRYQLMYKQGSNSVAFLEFKITLVEPGETVTPWYVITIEEEVPEEVMKVVVVEEPEVEEVVPQPEIVEEPIVEEAQSKPLTAIELEEAMSEAPKTTADGAVAIAPWRPAWKPRASEADVTKFLQNINKPLVDFTDQEIIPIKLNIDEITREGYLKIAFNQKMIPPVFGDARRLLNSTSITLLQKSDLDVSRDIMDVSFLSKAEGSNFVRYTLDITEWDENFMLIFINFTNPMAISNGEYRDTIVVQVKNPDIFISAVSGETLAVENSLLGSMSFPRQLPQDVSEAELRDDAELAANSFQSLLFVQIILQIALKGSIDDIWNLYLMLQLICFLSLYDTPISPNVEIYMEEFRKLVFFDILKPDKLIGIFYPGVTVQSLLQQGAEKEKEQFTGSMESSGVKSSGFLVNMAVYIFILGIFILSMIIIFVLSFVPFLRVKMRKIIKTAIENQFWNNTIRQVTLSYIELAKTFYIQARLEKQNGNPHYFLNSWPLMIFLFGYPLICLVVMLRMRNILETQSVKDRIGLMYHGVSLWRHKYTVIYYPIFILRRLLFIMIPVLIEHPAQQVQCLTFFSSIYLISYGLLWSHIEKSFRRIELFNEAFFILFNYHMFTFSINFIIDDSKYTQYTMGWSFIISIAFLIGVNMVFILYKAFQKALRARELRNMKKAMESRKRNEIELKKITEEEAKIVAENTPYEQKYGLFENNQIDLDIMVKRKVKKAKKAKKNQNTKNKLLETIQEASVEITRDEVLEDFEKELGDIFQIQKNEILDLEEQIETVYKPRK